MPSPPRDPPDDEARLDEVVSRVGDALDELHVVDSAERDALLASIREALASLGPVLIDGFEVRAVSAPGAPAGPPPVQVVEGGREGDEPTPGRRPELRVAPQPPESEPQAPPDLPPAPARPVTVVRLPARGPRAVDAGVILVGPGDWQSLLAARRPRSYRVGCREGRLHVYADGEATCEIGPGQTADVEGSVLRVHAPPGEGTGAGWYTRLGD
ncbi:MAG: hypothetical protein FJ102_16015 [Deltaproteobacteria bacterium]|nr:hypothetical protein [Deltaproteobacteria bacterium]